jgi:hypothetical protein
MEEVKSFLKHIRKHKVRLLISLFIIVFLHICHLFISKPTYYAEKTIYLKSGSSSVSSGLAGLIGLGGFGSTGVLAEEVNEYILSFEVFENFCSLYKDIGKIRNRFPEPDSYKNDFLSTIDTRADKLTNSIHIRIHSKDSLYVSSLTDFLTKTTNEHFRHEEEERERVILNGMDSKVDSLKKLLNIDISKYAILQDNSRNIYLNSNKVDEIILLKNIELNKVLLENYLRLTETTRAELKSTSFQMKDIYHTPVSGMREKRSGILYLFSSFVLFTLYCVVSWGRKFFL